ncbi:hypothetical protein EHB58_09575 [Salmonella enterica subsp. enterica serovar Hull]|uniref:Uncharacterized protein n=1 Tax=Salmonella enterica subsp. enterica serovar Hull TaxID=1403564 RepID=A0A5X4PEA0_SALET|nr:hypothetical protein [Salmonella enterica subsp. enterica serovar Hull]EBZ8648461.1 hypothetical protein [Salmonella enterica subsp. enterica serovar Hull]ECC3814897.1 hypothetical protein [Salmonella enterica subsp. enterica]EDH1765017.1 hypothetical protein [Salmonella enterica]EEA7993685.1 hypothetical protein [Salmonella enterica subsp. enterica]
MDEKEIRRRRLKEWFADGKYPEKDSSYISQVINGKSIGEKAARRLERDYGMPEKFLDKPFDVPEDKSVELNARQQKVIDLLDALPDDEVDDFIAKLQERKAFYDRRLQSYLAKNKLL